MMTCPHGEMTPWRCRTCQAAYQREYRRGRRLGPRVPRPVRELRAGDVLELVASGWADKEISQHLGVTHSTVRCHLEGYLRRIGMLSRTSAALVWMLSDDSTPEQRARVRERLGLRAAQEVA